MVKSRRCAALKSSVEVLRIRKCDKLSNFLIKNIGVPQKIEMRSAVIKTQIISLKNSNFFNF